MIGHPKAPWSTRIACALAIVTSVIVTAYYGLLLSQGNVLTLQTEGLRLVAPIGAAILASLFALCTIATFVGTMKGLMKMTTITYWTSVVLWLFGLGFGVISIIFIIKNGNPERDACIQETVDSGFENGQVLCGAQVSAPAGIAITTIITYHIIGFFCLLFIFRYWRRQQNDKLSKHEDTESHIAQVQAATWNKSYDPDNAPRAWSRFDDH